MSVKLFQMVHDLMNSTSTCTMVGVSRWLHLKKLS